MCVFRYVWWNLFQTISSKIVFFKPLWYKFINCSLTFYLSFEKKNALGQFLLFSLLGYDKQLIIQFLFVHCKSVYIFKLLAVLHVLNLIYTIILQTCLHVSLNLIQLIEILFFFKYFIFNFKIIMILWQMNYSFW